MVKGGLGSGGREEDIREGRGGLRLMGNASLFLCHYIYLSHLEKGPSPLQGLLLLIDGAKNSLI